MLFSTAVTAGKTGRCSFINLLVVGQAEAPEYFGPGNLKLNPQKTLPQDLQLSGVFRGLTSLYVTLAQLKRMTGATRTTTLNMPSQIKHA